jgi:DNA-binding NtrC family response regulator
VSEQEKNFPPPPPNAPVTQALRVEDLSEIYTFNKYRLRVVEGPDKGLEINADRRVITIGSAHDGDLVLDDATVSRRHCRIVFDGGGYILEDFGSRNGTYLESFRIKSAFLRPGVRIGLGSTTIQFELSGEQVNVYLSRGDRFGELYGRSLEMKEVFGILQRVAPTDATVLITGESGTGKELVARAVHDHSPRAKKPFLVFDCSAVPRELIESELFGHVKGAFTGAVQSRPGAFVAADGGTLFLDELGELPLDLQPKLLRVLETRGVKPLGSNDTTQIDVRIVAATNRPLEQMVQEGSFRQDLYYRLAVIQVPLPPLRHRPEDIPFLVNLFLRNQGKEGPGYVVSHDTMEKLKHYPWPGNVRELKNYVERAMILSTGREIDASLIPTAPSGMLATQRPTTTEHVIDLDVPFKFAKEQLVDRFERDYLVAALIEGDWNITQAAQRIGIHRKSLEYLMKKHNLRKP